MATLNAQQSVNTRDLPELAPITGDTYDSMTGQGAYVHGPGGIKYRFGDDDMNLPGTYVFAGGQVVSGPIASISVKTGGNDAYTITAFDLNIQELWADAMDNGGLDTVPAKIFKGDDTLNGSSFGDILHAFAGQDSVLGGAGDDQIDGGAGDDVLTGGSGADRLAGGADEDVFIFLSIKDSTKKASGRDSILDFVRADGDRIDLTAIDAKKGGGDQAFKFIKQQDFHEKKGELRYKVKKGDAFVQGDVNGDGKADFAIHVDNVSTLKAIDFDL